jgi:hypothetical protein
MILLQKLTLFINIACGQPHRTTASFDFIIKIDDSNLYLGNGNGPKTTFPIQLTSFFYFLVAEEWVESSTLVCEYDLISSCMPALGNPAAQVSDFNLLEVFAQVCVVSASHTGGVRGLTGVDFFKAVITQCFCQQIPIDHSTDCFIGIMQSFRIPYLGADGVGNSWPDMPGFWGTYVNITGFGGAFDVYRGKQQECNCD